MKRMIFAVFFTIFIIMMVTGCEGEDSKASVTIKPSQNSSDLNQSPVSQFVRDSLKSNEEINVEVAPASVSLGMVLSASFINQNQGWIIDGHYLLQTNDGGANWQVIYHEAVTESPKQGIRFTTEKDGWRINGNQLLRTLDGGYHWQSAPINGIDSPELPQFDNPQDGWVIGIKDGVKRLFHTIDGGQTWQVNQLPVKLNPDSIYSSYSFYFINAKDGWFVFGSEPGAGSQQKTLYRTTDGGMHWNEMKHNGNASMPFSGYVGTLQFINSSVGWMGGARGGIIATRDGGETWESICGDFDVTRAVQFVNQHVGYVIGENQLLKTLDGGTTWTQVYPLQFHLFSFLDAKIGFAIQNNHLVRTDDGGETWKTSMDLPAGNVIDLEFLNERQGWIISETQAANGQFTHILYKTEDGGKHWMNMEASHSPELQDRHVDFLDQDVGYLYRSWGSNGGLYLTTDGGKQWKPVAGSQTLAAYQFISVNIGYRIESFALQKSEDGGKSWHSVQTPQNDRWIRLNQGNNDSVLEGVAIHDSDHSTRIWALDMKAQHWREYTLPQIDIEQLEFIDPEHGWITAIDSRDKDAYFPLLYSTKDGGKSWHPIQ